MTIAFIGVGNIGFPMAQQLVAKGHRLVVHDLVREKAEPLLAKGAKWAASPKEAAQEADVVITSLPGPAHVRAVMEGMDGVLAGIKAGATWCETSTTLINQLKRHAEEVERRGGTVLECPVTGGVKNAYKGKITIFVSGEKSVFERRRTVLGDIGEKLIYLGPLGTAMTAKLITNMLCFVHEQALGEGLMLGKKAGLDLSALIEAIQASYGASFVAEADSPKILEGVYNTTFPILHACKDMMLTVQLAEREDVPLPLARFVWDAMEKARERYGDDADCLSPVKMAEEDAGIPLRP